MNNNKLNIKAVIFDLGSTLIEYEAVPWEELIKICVANVRKYLVRNNYEVPEEKEFFNVFEGIKKTYRENAMSTLVEWTIPQATSKLLDELKITRTDGLIEKLFESYYKPVAERIYVYDDTYDTLLKIKEKIGVVGLISNTIFPEQTHLGELEKYKIIDFFDFTIFSSTFGLRKPHPDIFYQASNFAGYAPSECVYIGDRYVEDVTGPESIGMPAILKVQKGREYPDDMPEKTRKINTLSELDEHLEL